MRYLTRPLTPEARDRMTGKGQEMSPFSAPWSTTSRLLEHELSRLHPRGEIVLMVDVTESDIRLDGKIRADARPITPGVALAVTSTTKGSLLICCGRFRNWKDNTRAIALGLEALRKVERYGITQSDEQYRGWRALNAGGIEDWVTVLAAHSGWSYDEVKANPEGAYNAAVKTAHPDRGGTREAFDAVQMARR